MKKITAKTLLTTLITLLMPVCFSIGWHYCNQKEQKNYILQHFDISNLPTKFKPNSLVRVSITGLNTTTITKGDEKHFPYITVKLGYNNKYIVNRKEKICNYVRCPIKKGTISYLIRTRIHALAPGGKYNLHLKLINSKNKTLTCVVGNVYVDSSLLNPSKNS